MFKFLEKFQEKDQFQFNAKDRLSQVCNAPNHSSGIYLVYAEEVSIKNLIYIGISGREGQNGEIIHRQDGIGGRIIKGKQFKEARRRSWPQKMEEDGIEKLHVHWYITHGKYDQRIPREIERKLLLVLQAYRGSLPIWNKQV
ncbi:hypothetical protein [Salinimicrobium flavum]|uniref:GIY-YIG domain-containing protein n=1 Tax=Salinimicrobium flavum TaxID=1737065 RepID=A0ABW5IZ82_9FLAO